MALSYILKLIRERPYKARDKDSPQYFIVTAPPILVSCARRHRHLKDLAIGGMHASRNLAISNKIAEVGERRFSQSSVQTLSGRKVANLFEQAIVSVPFADLNADCVGQARHGLQLPKLRCHGIGMIDKDAAP